MSGQLIEPTSFIQLKTEGFILMRQLLFISTIILATLFSTAFGSHATSALSSRHTVEAHDYGVAGRSVTSGVSKWFKGRFTQVSADNENGDGFQTLCAVRTDRSILCRALRPLNASTVPKGRYDAVSVGAFFECAVMLVSGKAKCWGSDLGGDATPPPGVFSEISAGGEFACGLRTMHIACWGHASPLHGRVRGHYSSLSAGDGLACAIGNGQRAHCWGEAGTIPRAALRGPFASISASGPAVCGVLTTGRIRCWGGTPIERSTPPGQFTQVSTGLLTACAIRRRGGLARWGASIHGRPNGRRFRQVTVGNGFACAITTGRRLVCWGDVPDISG